MDYNPTFAAVLCRDEIGNRLQGEVGVRDLFVERERGWRNDDDDDDDDRATMMNLEVGESKGRGTTREEVL